MAKTAQKAFGGAKVIYIAKAYVEKESKQPQPQGDNVIQRPTTDQRGDLITYCHNSIEMNSYHSRCLRIKADCSVNLGIEVLEENEKKQQAVLDKMTIVNEERQSFQEVCARVCLDFHSIGNGYLEVVRGQDNKSIAELYHAPGIHFWRRKKAGNVAPLLYRSGDGREKDFYFYDPDKPPEDKEAGEVIVFQNYTQASRYYGLPDWRGVIPKIELDYYATLYNQKFFINSGVPDMAIVVEGGKFDEEVEKAVQQFFTDQFKGWANSHRTLYLPINDKDITVRFEKLALDKEKEGSFKELQADCRDSIVSSHGVPPRLVGIISAGQLGGGGEANSQLKIFQETTINPVQDLFEMKLKPVTRAMEIEEDWRFKEIDTKIQEKDSELYPNLVASDILDINEARDELGYGPKDDLNLGNNDQDQQMDEMINELEKMIGGM